ncbi:MAG: DNA translocase FtsK [Opitutales bacterium]|nr:DNA translocase FtsK [Opitutales bacterium]
MAKKKQVEKLGEVIGKSHPFLGGTLLLLGIIMLVSILGYGAGQEVLFKHYFEPFLSSTESGGNHICGKLGATLALLSMLILGAASYMLPLYVLWFGIRCLSRRAVIITKWESVCVVIGIVSLAVLSIVFQDFLGTSAPIQNAHFPCGWGGKIGYVIYEKLTKVLLDTTGNVLVFGSIYLTALFVVFVDSPIDAVIEMGNGIVWMAKLIWKFIISMFITVLSLPKILIESLFKRRKEDFDASDINVDNINLNEQESKKAKVVTSSDSADVNPDIDIDELSMFAEEMGHSIPTDKKNTAELVAVVEDSKINDIAEELQTDDDFETSDVNVVDFTGIEIKLPEIQNNNSQSESKVSQETSPEILEEVKVISSEESEKLSQVDVSIDKSSERKRKNNKYVFPSLKLLVMPEKKDDVTKENYLERMTEIINVIGQFGVKVLPGEAFSGPVITRYEVQPAPGVKISRITNLEDDITAGIKAEKVRMIAPVPGRGTVGIEVPNKNRLNVSMREILESKQWRNNSYEIPIALGKDATGVPIVANLKKMTHALIAGSTNSGKSVCINTIIISMLYKMSPEDLRLIMIDPKMVELQGYNTVPHMLIPVVSDVKKAAAALKWLTGEMMRRYSIFKQSGVRNIDGFNAKILKDKEDMAKADAEFASMSPEERQAALQASSEIDSIDKVDIPKEKMPYIVCIIDELADLMSVVGKEVEQYIARITQLARAAGIHMIIATQRPDVKVITGMIKNNLPTRIAFKVTSQIDSRTILDSKGAESLIGWGDMLFLNNGAPDVVRAQGAYLSDEEIEAVVEALKVNGEPQYAEDVQAQIDASDEDDDEIGEGEGGKYNDPMTVKAINVIRVAGKASTSLLQRKLGIGYGRAARIMDELEDNGLVGPDNGSGKRDLFLD